MRILRKAFLFSLVFLAVAATGFAMSIVNSKHNLSVTGTGDVKAAMESEICIFCHTPHSASSAAPLWNRHGTGETYTPYSSTTMDASIGQPVGSSKVCLSCHDGTVATALGLGRVRSRSDEDRIIFPTGFSVIPVDRRSNLGVNLSDDHPISFRYDTSLSMQDPELKDPSTLSKEVALDSSNQFSGYLQCTTCHDPHNNEYGNFLAVNNVNSSLCLECHDVKGWFESFHANAAKSWNGISPDPWPHTDLDTVSENGCESCHTMHGAGSGKRLLYHAEEEENCLVCHNSNVAEKNIASELTKSSTHPVGNYINEHDPTEPIKSGLDHVECVDCHNPHAVSGQGEEPILSSLRFVKGITLSGTEIEHINHEYELCFRCHSDGVANKIYVSRQHPSEDTRAEFDPSNASYHPVGNVGRNSEVPSLISPYTTSSIIKCTDCHNNNTGPNNGGMGANGPHGSMYAPILERQLSFTDGLSESSEIYALCYKCHDRNSILGNESFSKHSNHIAVTSCTVCHDPHGVSGQAHLINFDEDIVDPADSGSYYFQDLGRFTGTCYLKCHNVNHDSKSY